jgi:hypothetical protein
MPCCALKVTTRQRSCGGAGLAAWLTSGWKRPAIVSAEVQPDGHLGVTATARERHGEHRGAHQNVHPTPARAREYPCRDALSKQANQERGPKP